MERGLGRSSSRSSDSNPNLSVLGRIGSSLGSMFARRPVFVQPTKTKLSAGHLTARGAEAPTQQGGDYVERRVAVLGAALEHDAFRHHVDMQVNDGVAEEEARHERLMQGERDKLTSDAAIAQRMEKIAEEEELWKRNQTKATAPKSQARYMGIPSSSAASPKGGRSQPLPKGAQKSPRSVGGGTPPSEGWVAKTKSLVSTLASKLVGGAKVDKEEDKESKENKGNKERADADASEDPSTSPLSSDMRSKPSISARISSMVSARFGSFTLGFGAGAPRQGSVTHPKSSSMVHPIDAAPGSTPVLTLPPLQEDQDDDGDDRDGDGYGAMECSTNEVMTFKQVEPLPVPEQEPDQWPRRDVLPLEPGHPAWVRSGGADGTGGRRRSSHLMSESGIGIPDNIARHQRSLQGAQTLTAVQAGSTVTPSGPSSSPQLDMHDGSAKPHRWQAGQQQAEHSSEGRSLVDDVAHTGSRFAPMRDPSGSGRSAELISGGGMPGQAGCSDRPQTTLSEDSAYMPGMVPGPCDAAAVVCASVLLSTAPLQDTGKVAAAKGAAPVSWRDALKNRTKKETIPVGYAD